MFNLSAPVASSQQSPHKNLQRKLSLYENSNYRNSIPKYARDEFNRFQQVLYKNRAQIILDSGCGTGESSVKLAMKYPQCLVVGVDKSANRMRKCNADAADLKNILYVRCDLIHFWRLLQQAQYQLYKHYLFYPNPWPKPGHLQRRWHAHPVFPAVISLGGELVMRTNWRVYAQEFALALRAYTTATVSIAELKIVNAISAFEKKYATSNHILYQVKTNLSLD